MSSKVALQIVASLIDAARGVIYDRNMAIPLVYGTGVICDDRNSFIIFRTIFVMPVPLAMCKLVG